MTARWKAVAALSAVFLAGVAVGGVAVGVAAKSALVRFLDRPLEDARNQAVVFRMDEAVGLTAAQRQAVGEVLRHHQPEREAVRRRMQPELAAIRQAQWAEMRAALTDAQRPAFDRLIAEWEARLQHDAGGGS